MTKNYAPQNSKADGQLVRTETHEIYFEEYGIGEPLILLHGFGGCSQNWHPFIDELSKKYRLILIDLRGHGYSNNPTLSFTHKEAAKDVLLLLAKLEIEKFYAMGMSTGGMVLMHIASQNALCIRAMVLISVTTYFPLQARAIMRRASYETIPKEVREMYRECAKHGEGQIRLLLSQFNAFSDNHEDINFSKNELARISSPTLIVHGEKDNFFPISIAENICQTMPHATLWIIPSGDHVPIFDRKIPFTKIALEFLSGIK